MDEVIKTLLEPCKICGDTRRIQNPEYQPPRFLDKGETYTTPAFIECPHCNREALVSGLCQQQMELDALQAELQTAKEENRRLKDEERNFELIWQAIKHWDVETVEGEGYHGITGDDVRVILQALKDSGAKPE